MTFSRFAFSFGFLFIVGTSAFAEEACKLINDVAQKAADGSLFNEKPAVSAEEQRIWVRQQDTAAGKVTGMLEKRDLVEVSIPNGDGTFTTVKGRVSAVDQADNVIEVGGKKIPLRQDNGMLIKKFDEDGNVVNSVNFDQHPGLSKKIAAKAPQTTPQTQQNQAPRTPAAGSGSTTPARADFAQIDQLDSSQKVGLTRRFAGRQLTIEPKTGAIGPSDARFLRENKVHIVGEQTNGGAVHGGQFNLGKYDPWVVLENDSGQRVRIRWDDVLNVTGK